MSCFSRLAASIALAALLAACQPPPRPFATDASTERANLLLESPDSAGIVVDAVEGLPPALGEELRAAVVDTLQRARILATPGPGNRASYHLRGYASAAPTANSDAARTVRAYVTWQLVDAAGRERASFTSTPELRPGAVAQSSARALDNIARRVSDGLRDSRILASAHGTTDEPTRPLLSVTILPVEGAPGDGRQSLTQALQLILRNAGIRVASDIDADGLIVYGDVAVTPVPPQRDRPDLDHVEIRWRVGWADGREVGRVSQTNEIQAGLLRRRWGQIALAAAEGAAAGIVSLVREAEAAPQPVPPTVASPSPAPPSPPAASPPRSAPGNWNQVYSNIPR